MRTRTRKWFLVIIALALAVAPLRVSWAMSDTTDNGSHCAQMQDDIQSTNLSNGCCGKDCSMTACNICAHGTTAVTNGLTIPTGTSAPPLNTTSVYRYPEHTITPLLRPPASL